MSATRVRRVGDDDPPDELHGWPRTIRNVCRLVGVCAAIYLGIGAGLLMRRSSDTRSAMVQLMAGGALLLAAVFLGSMIEAHGGFWGALRKMPLFLVIGLGVAALAFLQTWDPPMPFEGASGGGGGDSRSRPEAVTANSAPPKRKQNFVTRLLQDAPLAAVLGVQSVALKPAFTLPGRRRSARVVPWPRIKERSAEQLIVNASQVPGTVARRATMMRRRGTVVAGIGDEAAHVDIKRRSAATYYRRSLLVRIDDTMLTLYVATPAPLSAAQWNAMLQVASLLVARLQAPTGRASLATIPA